MSRAKHLDVIIVPGRAGAVWKLCKIPNGVREYLTERATVDVSTITCDDCVARIVADQIRRSDV